MAAPPIPPAIILQLPTPVAIRIIAPTATQRVEVYAIDPGIDPWNISKKE